MTAERKQDSLRDKIEAIGQAIDKRLKTTASIMLASSGGIKSVEKVPTSIPALDFALGGGIGRGRIVEIYGPYSSGKSTVAQHIIGSFHEAAPDLSAAFIDMEQALDLDYASQPNFGIDLDRLIISQPSCAEDALEIIRMLAKSGLVSVIVLDSVAALVPRSELEGDTGASQVGSQARLMSAALRQIVGIASKSKVSLIFLNQIRMKIGAWGNPEVSAGGEALKFYSSQRIELRKCSKEGGTTPPDYVDVKAKVIKNKIAPPFRQTVMRINYGLGVDKTASLVQLGLELGEIERHGSWYAFDGENLAQGQDGTAALLESDPELKQRITETIYNKYLAPNVSNADGEAPVE